MGSVCLHFDHPSCVTHSRCRRLQLTLTRALFLVQGGGHSQADALLRAKVFRDYMFHGREVVVNGTAAFTGKFVGGGKLY